VLRSPHAHARVRALDSSAAEALPGVHLVWHRDQPPPINQLEGRELFAEELAYHGAEVALVVATDERVAEDGVSAIDVRYDELPFVASLEAALADDAPPALLGSEDNLIGAGGRTYERGDVEKGWAEAEVSLTLSFTTPNASHSALEPHATVARWEGDDLTVWESTQGVFGVRDGLAEALGVPRDRVRVICSYMGGGFGAKQQPGRHTILAALAARELERPVRLVLGRGEEQLVSGYRPASRQTIRIGARRDGTLTCLEHDVWEHMGAFGHPGYMVAGPTQSLYACPNVRTAVHGVRVNTDRGRAFRGPGYVEGIFALEGAMDALARELGIDPLDIRLKNYTEVDPTREEPYTTKGLREAYEIGAQRISWRDRSVSAPESGPWRRGWGMASQIWGGGGGPPANAIVKLLPDGTAEVLVGVQDIGTGTRTVLAQIAAEELGIPLASVGVVLGDTQATPYGPTSAGSQTLPSAGPAVRAAARACLRQVLDLASQMLGMTDAGADQLLVEDGMVIQESDPDVRIPFREVAAKMDGYTSVGDGARGPNPAAKRVNTFGAHFAEVEVNVETGEVRVIKVVAVHDIGRVINPLTASNQVYGGVIQGLGLGMTEERVMDEESGRQLTPNLETYKVPTMMDTPIIEVSFVDRPDAEANSVGAKGLGEPPIIPAPAAVANAISDAIGVRMTHLPMTPQIVLRALQDGKER
jgi:xanthine dehydrogenase YagR molybdenum-binding subunit